MKRKRWLGLLLATAMMLALLPMTAFATPTQVYMGGGYLSDGANSVGGGTATLDVTQNTLTLENVSVTDYIWINSDSAFTIIAKGTNAVGTADAPVSGSALWSENVPTLNINVESGAELGLYAGSGNGLYLPNGVANISGPGKLIASAEYPAIFTKGDLNLNGGLQAEIVSDSNGIQVSKGNINIENAKLTVDAYYVALFAQMYDEITDADIPSAVTMKNSTVSLTTGECQGVYCGSGGILVEDTVLTTKTDKEIYAEGYSLYSYGDITIKGDDTVINADDDYGIAADDGVLRIEGGKVDVCSTDVALTGWYGVEITGGTISASAEEGAAVLATEGLVQIKGADTKLTATSNSSDTAAISNGITGGILLDADITAKNTANYTPIEGKNKDKSVAIALGAGVGAVNINGQTTGDVVVYNEADTKFSYFILADGESTDAVLDTVKICKHTWGAPVWSWNAEHTAASALFTCTKDAGHTAKVDGTITALTTDATCGSDGSTVYTATATFNGSAYTDEKTVSIPATGAHHYVDGTCTVCGAEEKTETDVPKTGDASNPALWTALALFAAGAFGITFYGRRKEVK